VGDRVAGVRPGGCWGSFITCDARLVAPLPAGLTAEEAAAVATGGVGQAAIAIARAAGAEIFATAGSPDRRQLLADIGIEHVYDSRSTEFADEIRRNLAFYYADLALMTVADPERSGALLRKVYQMVGDGALPVQRCPAHRQAGADRAARRPGACRDAAGPGAGFPPDGSYIVTGGMGGLGLSWPPRWRRRTAAGSFRPRGPGRMSRRRGPLRG
jgi:hypothetical protein